VSTKDLHIFNFIPAADTSKQFMPYFVATDNVLVGKIVDNNIITIHNSHHVAGTEKFSVAAGIDEQFLHDAVRPWRQQPERLFCR